jgi:hypothetical protein
MFRSFSESSGGKSKSWRRLERRVWGQEQARTPSGHNANKMSSCKVLIQIG